MKIFTIHACLLPLKCGNPVASVSTMVEGMFLPKQEIIYRYLQVLAVTYLKQRSTKSLTLIL